MKLYLVLFVTFLSISQNFAQKKAERIEKDSLIIIRQNPKKGFHNDYLLFIPKGTPKNKQIYLLVEPNNTGTISDSMEVHRKSAIHTASVSSVGNNISTELKIPLLVPIFPRPESKALVYTHALDRDVIFEKSESLKRLDLQLINMINHGKEELKHLGIMVNDQIFMNGFSASASFTNRFSFLHPEIIKALAIGGFNGELMLPLSEYKGEKLNYPLGINDIKKITKEAFNETAFKNIPQYIYMGALDDNDAVQYDDAYNDDERRIINTTLGNQTQNRWQHCQQIYKNQSVNAKYTTYENVGHETTSKVNLDVILFFNEFLKKALTNDDSAK
ncbi:MAG TPA: hypothetical protein VLB74_10075 [Flavobacterium sp.]|uniref:hypothetical protein n=1 Tax=Flavobacterium sp. TaxID=239 RepID=UPI002C0A91C5|nr:hypothetical protein [Flavobacterium sp.]HSD14983.1 hypothetical protein [Flavobacterium sp.]